MLIMAFLSSSLLTKRCLAVVNSLQYLTISKTRNASFAAARCLCFSLCVFSVCCTVLFSHLCAILKLLTVSGDITPLAPAFCADLLHGLHLP